ncbi:TRAP transporter large permease (plasmid) [Paracoccus saliphilus]|uniref:TRAP transporter large permease n=1 Tax=Paracoccus saliphilus TaxID=405559 RepID=A0ABY7SG96_9RHOB|nr:TRAP transporter large permease [Paracoccus saliphilus]WCR05588.1 TRAP transporter large permease [Paracoccus saliphilus]
MSWQAAALLLGGGVMFLMALGTPVVIAFLTVNLIGAVAFMGGLGGIDQLIANATSSITSFALVPVPLFILMGELLFHTGMAVRVFDALDKILGAIRARLAYLTVIGGTIFATLSGSSIANTAMLGSTLMPDMEKRGYKKSLIMGPIIATGSIAMIIPPSSLAVLLGSLAKIDVGALLLAGVVPGIILSVMYLAVIRLHVWIDPEAAPPVSPVSVPTREKALAMLRDVAPMGLVIFAVIGLIILGVASPTESAAFGVLAVAILALFYGKLRWPAVEKALWGTLSVSVMMLVIILASSTFSQLLAFSGASAGLVAWMAGFELGPHATLLAMLAVLVLLGMFMDQLSIMMLTLPIFMPLIAMQGIDPLQFGIIMLLALELSLATPPFGLLLFVMLGVAPKGTSIWEVVRACLPYLACTLVLILTLIWLPGLIIWQ